MTAGSLLAGEEAAEGVLSLLPVPSIRDVITRPTLSTIAKTGEVMIKKNTDRQNIKQHILTKGFEIKFISGNPYFITSP